MRNKNPLKRLILAACALMALAACKKEVPEQTLQGSNSEPVLKGITVSEGRLKFTSAAFLEALEADRAKTKEILAYVGQLEGFTSLKEKKSANNITRRSSCNCDVDDDFVNEIADDWYMFDVDEWTVKVDGCNETFYALDRVGLTAAEIDEKVERLRHCVYEPIPHVYSFPFERELYDVLMEARDEIDGGIHPTLIGCGDVACSDREDVSWEYTEAYHSLPFQTHVPRVYVKYKRGVAKGTITSWFEDRSSNDPNNPWRWKIEYADCEYRERCGDLHTRGATNMSVPFIDCDYIQDGSRFYWIYEEYYGKRLKAGFGNYKLRLVSYSNPGPGCSGCIDSDWVEILF